MMSPLVWDISQAFLKSSFSGLGIDVKNNFKPTYIVTTDKKKVVRELKKK